MTKAVVIRAFDNATESGYTVRNEVGIGGHIKVATPVEVIDLSDDTLTKLQDAVGGWVQAVDLTEDVTLWCNEEGKMNGLPFNAIATSLWIDKFGETDIIVGDVVLTGGADDEGELLTLTAEALDRLGIGIGDTLREAVEAVSV
jgi:hypothetical protein